MRQIVRIKFGSHLYGTDTPSSDIDYKAVHIPDARDILLQRAKGSLSQKRQKAEGEKNLAGEIDEESYSLQRYLNLLSEGQTVALDVLFAPESSMTEPPSNIWREVVSNRHRILTKRASAFVGYCRQQANKYGIKGSRVAASRAALGFLDQAMAAHGTTARLGSIADEVEALARVTEHSRILDIPNASGTVIRYWDVCGRKLQYTASIKMARDTMKKLVDEYGHRALAAERQEGVDWKALSHAVRVGRQALEFLETGRITFPLPYAEHILAIKTGAIPYQPVGEEIERLLEQVEEAAGKSLLPDSPDMDWIDDFVCRVYREEIGN